MSELWKLSAAELAENISSRQISAHEATQSAVERMHAVNPDYNAVAIDCSDTALKAAKEIDDRIGKGENAGSLAGVPVTVKVNIDQAGYANTNGLRIQQGLIAESDSPVVQNLKAAGAIVIARTNTPAFSMRWFTRNSLHGHTLNPLNTALTPGGSSGGAASAVASGIGALAHGTDIAGSIRYPAFACGIHGLRPSLGRIPAYNPSLPDRLIGGQLMAVSGPLARSIKDLELGFHAMAGSDAIAAGGSSASINDVWWAPVPLELPQLERRVALCMQPADHVTVQQPLIDAMQHAAKKLQDQGWQVEEVECPSFSEAADINIRLWMEEMKSVRAAVAEENDADANFVFQQLEAMASAHATASVMQLFQRRATLTRKWQAFLQEYPVLMCPPSAELPFPDQLDVESESAFKRVFDAQLTQIGLPLTGLPGLCVTTGFVSSETNEKAQAPVGVQLIGQRFREDMLLQAGRLLEADIPACG